MVRSQDGTAVLGLLGPLLAALVVALVVVIDLGAYATAVSRAQAAADAAALAAAVAAHPDHGSEDPALVARHLAIEAGGDVVRCDCPRGWGAEVTVVVRFRVGGLVIPRVWAASVDATAQATADLVVPD